MLRIYWIFIISQAFIALGFAFGWPDSQWLWIFGILSYLLLSFILFKLGTELAQKNRLYYLITVAGTSFNWVVFGALGFALSWLLSLLSLVG